MVAKYGCVIITLTFLFCYEVSTQNHYYTQERDGYDYVSIPEQFGYHYPPAPQRINGNIGNGQSPFPNALYNYPLTYKPLTQEVPVKVMKPSVYDNKDANSKVDLPTDNKNMNHVTPKVEAYLVERESNDGNDHNNLKLSTKDNKKALDSGTNNENHEVNDKDRDKENTISDIKKQTIENVIDDTDYKINVDDRKEEITHSINSIENKQNLIKIPLTENMNMTISDILPRIEPDVKNQRLLKNVHIEETKDNVKKIEITLPQSDTTTLIISSRKEDEPSKNVNEERKNKQNSLLGQQISLGNLKTDERETITEPKNQNLYLGQNLRKNNQKSYPKMNQNLPQQFVQYPNIYRRNMRTNDKAIDSNKPSALNRKLWPIPLAYPINSHKINTPSYPYYPYNMLYPKL